MRISDWSSDVCSSDLYYIELMKKVRETPEWKDFMAKGGYQHLHDVGELPALDERAAAPVLGEQRDGDGAEAGDHHRQADVEREVSGFRPVLRPAHAEPQAVHHHDAADDGNDRGDDDVRRTGRHQAVARLF